MKRSVFLLAALAALALPPLTAEAQEKVKVGILVTLSGPAAVLGGQIRDGFNLAVKNLGGKLGGVDAEVIVADDELKPDVAVTKVKELLDRDQVNFVVGPVFSNVLHAIHKPVTDSTAFLISPNAGTSNFAGKQCNANFFVTSYQNDQNHEVMGKYAQDKGYKSVFLMAPNYQAGKDAVAGFKRYFKGDVADEVYTPLGQLDFSAELAKVAADKPDAFFTFMPGGMGVNLVKQYRQAGLDTIPFLSAFTTDESTLPAQKDDAIGFLAGANWAPDMNNPQSKAFVAAYEAAYGKVPGTYAMQAYDAALLIDSAIKGAGGKVGDHDAVRAELKKANFTSLRGKFKFGVNNYPIQDFYLVRVAKRPDGKFETKIVDRIFTDYVDPYAADCPLK
ncbi:MAG: ABC transporter substrate-binding protein [Hyphomicrobiales bacterium]|nr:ABC transporter substrate-binding protein [Hyphomicrobiales bacterium]